jgi:TfoX/Sxy family transcriptional regulator of competence genes
MPADPQDAVDRLAEQFLADPRVQRGRMFGATALKLGGKVFAMLVKGELVVKLSTSEAGDLVDAGVGAFFDPGHGRPMRQWVAVSATHALQWQRLAAQAREHAGQA